MKSRPWEARTPDTLIKSQVLCYPIIFSSESVRAILDLLKTMTRRTRGLEEINKDPDRWVSIGRFVDGYGDRWCFRRHGIDEEVIVKCPYGGVGDRLWVKETWAAQFFYDDYPPRDIPTDSVIFYRMNDRLKLEIAKEHHDLGKWRPSIFMPRWASRILLEITNIRVSRVQGISESDIISEGCCEFPSTFDIDELELARRDWFAGTWNSLNAKRGYGWDKNNWVWVISFKVLNATKSDG